MALVEDVLEESSCPFPARFLARPAGGGRRDQEVKAEKRKQVSPSVRWWIQSTGLLPDRLFQCRLL